MRSHLREQISFLESSASSFDNGFEGEAKRLALTIRVLVHDTKSSTSLLHQLDLKHELRISSKSTPDVPGNALTHAGLTMMKVETADGAKHGTSTYVARINAPPRDLETTRMSFRSWWNEPVVRDFNRDVFTRKDVVLAVANKDGGGHIDPELDAPFANLTRFNSMGWYFEIVGEMSPKAPENNIAFASIRQIAYELLQSLEILDVT